MYVLRNKRKVPSTGPWGCLGNEKAIRETDKELSLRLEKTGECGVLGSVLTFFILTPCSEKVFSHL